MPRPHEHLPEPTAEVVDLEWQKVVEASASHRLHAHFIRGTGKRAGVWHLARMPVPQESAVCNTARCMGVVQVRRAR